ncbi:L-asparaginase [Catellatospora sp. TT07R-123]|uniref:asparaginase n=1 Tax=Catellatospora sp. TT07R-123 TaxID=2733863 RepID=UPI001B101AE6|nr:asparaginase [Catellatospora sp. TT07R-123]GHJ48786.1 L-asparaginase [Catellatospora sp. TT07R-123]
MTVRLLLLALKDTYAHTHRGDRPAVATADELLAAAGPLAEGVHVAAADVMAEPSWDISPTTMLALARRVRAALLDDGYQGVVVAHGPDTLEESAYLTDLLAGPAADRGAIVFTGGLRRLDDPDADAPGNLADAITAAADPVLTGVGAVVCAAGELHAARLATLVDADRVALFDSGPAGPLGQVIGTKVELLAAPPPRPPAVSGEPEPDVALIATYPGMEPGLLHAAVDAGARGVVLAGTGSGNIPVGLLSTVGELVGWDIPVVVASRSATGAVALADLPPGTGLAAGMGAIGARGLAPAKARVALMAALGGGGVEAVRDWFARL